MSSGLIELHPREEREPDSAILPMALGRRLRIPSSETPAHGGLALQLWLEGETIVDLEVEVGSGHRGFEKECESGNWGQALPYVDRLNPRAAVLPSLAFCLGVERMLEIALPERGQWLRVLASECARVVDHLTRLGVTCLELGAETPHRHALAGRERAAELLADLTGRVGGIGWMRIGGFASAPPPDLHARVQTTVSRLRATLDTLEHLTIRNRFFVDRLRDVAVLSPERCLAYAVTGPLLRAAGVARDLRKDEPYLTYADIDFDLPIGSVGDDFDRWLVVLEETRQSLRIVEQASTRLLALTARPLEVADPRVRWPAPHRVRTELDAMIHHFQGVLEGPPVPAGECYQAIESANGELGFLLVSDGSPRPVRLRCRAPSFFHAQALPEMLRGAQLADVAPTLALLNSIGAKCDR